jgi:hypothetical protein
VYQCEAVLVPLNRIVRWFSTGGAQELHTYAVLMYIYTSAAAHTEPRLNLSGIGE